MAQPLRNAKPNGKRNPVLLAEVRRRQNVLQNLYAMTRKPWVDADKLR